MSNSDYQMSDFRMMRNSDRINNTDSVNKTDLYKGDKNNLTEKDQKQEQDHLQSLSSAMKLTLSQAVNHLSLKGVQDAN